MERLGVRALAFAVQELESWREDPAVGPVPHPTSNPPRIRWYDIPLLQVYPRPQIFQVQTLFFA